MITPYHLTQASIVGALRGSILKPLTMPLERSKMPLVAFGRLLACICTPSLVNGHYAKPKHPKTRFGRCLELRQPLTRRLYIRRTLPTLVFGGLIRVSVQAPLTTLVCGGLDSLALLYFCTCKTAMSNYAVLLFFLACSIT